ncbi:hypothetical protein CapIbe_017144 [Capra ibex]
MPLCTSRDTQSQAQAPKRKTASVSGVLGRSGGASTERPPRRGRFHHCSHFACSCLLSTIAWDITKLG